MVDSNIYFKIKQNKTCILKIFVLYLQPLRIKKLTLTRTIATYNQSREHFKTFADVERERERERESLPEY